MRRHYGVYIAVFVALTALMVFMGIREVSARHAEQTFLLESTKCQRNGHWEPVPLKPGELDAIKRDLDIINAKLDDALAKTTALLYRIEAVETRQDALQAERGSLPSRNTRGVTEMVEGEIYVTTGYCTCVICCGIWSAEHPSRIGTDFVQLTANGDAPVPGVTVGSDWEVLKPGTKIWIDGLGERIVQDKGAGIQGKMLDVLYQDHESALSHGRQNLRVKVVE